QLVVDAILVQVAPGGKLLQTSLMCSVGKTPAPHSLSYSRTNIRVTLPGVSSRDGILAGIYKLETESEGILSTGRVRCRDTLIPPSFDPSTVHGFLADRARSHSPPGSLCHFSGLNHVLLIDIVRL